MTCPVCGHLLQHHWDAGCQECDCKIPETEARYRAILAGQTDDDLT